MDHDKTKVSAMRWRSGDGVPSQRKRFGQPGRRNYGKTKRKVEMQHLRKLVYRRTVAGGHSGEFEPG